MKPASSRDRVLEAQARATELLDELEDEARAAGDQPALEHLANVRQLIEAAYAATLARRARAA